MLVSSCKERNVKFICYSAITKTSPYGRVYNVWWIRAAQLSIC